MILIRSYYCWPPLPLLWDHKMSLSHQSAVALKKASGTQKYIRRDLFCCFQQIPAYSRNSCSQSLTTWPWTINYYISSCSYQSSPQSHTIFSISFCNDSASYILNHQQISLRDSYILYQVLFKKILNKISGRIILCRTHTLLPCSLKVSFSSTSCLWLSPRLVHCPPCNSYINPHLFQINQ